MRIFQKLGFVIGAFLMMGCVSFPTKQLSFDVSDEPFPVMLTPVENPGVTKKFEFNAGYSTEQSASSMTNNGITFTNSFSMARNDELPVSQQLQNLFVQDPTWLEITDLHLEVHRFDMFFLSSSLEKVNYVTHVSIETPYQPRQDGQK